MARRRRTRTDDPLAKQEAEIAAHRRKQHGEHKALFGTEHPDDAPPNRARTGRRKGPPPGPERISRAFRMKKETLALLADTAETEGRSQHAIVEAAITDRHAASVSPNGEIAIRIHPAIRGLLKAYANRQTDAPIRTDGDAIAHIFWRIECMSIHGEMLLQGLAGTGCLSPEMDEWADNIGRAVKARGEETAA